MSIADELYSDLDRAQYQTVHGYSGKSKSLAPLLGINYKVLDNKVDPNQERNKLMLSEAITLMAITQNFSILSAAASMLGHAVIKLPTSDLANTSDLELLDCWMNWQADCGETASTIKDALADGQINKAELKKIKKEIYEDISRELELLQRLEALVG